MPRHQHAADHQHGDTILHWARSYDVLVGVLTLGRERRFRRHLAELAGLEPGWSVLDIGCGTGGLALAAAGVVGPSGRVNGVDASAEMVARARRKAARAGAAVQFDSAPAEALPFDDATFDAVTASLMLHHLTDANLRSVLAEVARVLRPGGRFLAVDIGGTAGQGPGVLHRFAPRHGDFDLARLAPVVAEAGLRVVEQGPVGQPAVLGLKNLQYLRAEPA